MRASIISCFLFLVTLAAAWTNEDYEIFDLVEELQQEEGKGVTFYSLLGVEPSATLPELTKAYRKKSLEMHPDKNPGVPNIEDRFARLGVIAEILRTPAERKRYDFFLKNGVPKWRGTGYYYSRYRPTLSHTIIVLIILTSGVHMLVMRMNYNKDKKRVKYFEDSARAAAGLSKELKEAKAKANLNGDVKATRRRKVKVPMVEGNDGAGFLDLIVVGEEVFLPHEDGSETPLNTLATRPQLLNLWPIRLSVFTYQKITSVFPGLRNPMGLISSVDRRPSAASSIEYEEFEDTPDSSPAPATARKGRASELKKQERLNGGKKGNGAATNGEAQDSSTNGSEIDTSDIEDADEPKKKRGLGKAGGARRRKMLMKR